MLKKFHELFQKIPVSDIPVFSTLKDPDICLSAVPEKFLYAVLFLKVPQKSPSDTLRPPAFPEHFQ